MKKSNKFSFIAGFALAAVLFGGTAAVAASGVLAVPTTSGIIVNGSDAKIEAYNIGGANYFKLRDVARIADFWVSYEAESNLVIIDTNGHYVEQGNAAPSAVSVGSVAVPPAPAETPFPYKVGDTPSKCNSKSDWTFALPDNDYNRQFAFLNTLWTGGCNWYREGRFHEVTGVYWEDCLGKDIGIHTTAKMYLELTQKHPERLDAITDMNAIRSQSIALYHYPELGHGHQVFVEYVERDANGKPMNVYYTQANSGDSANNQFDDGIDGVVEVAPFDEFIVNCIGFIALKPSA